MQKTFRKDYVETLNFIADQFTEKFQSVREALSFTLNIITVKSFDFKEFHKNIKKYEQEQEKEIFKIISLQTPNTKDLRLLLGIYKSSSDLTRISKTLQKIANLWRNLDIEKSIDLPMVTELEEMGKNLLFMIDQTILLTGKRKLSIEDAQKFKDQLLDSDEYVDNLFKGIKKFLVRKIVNELETKKEAKLVAEMFIAIRHMEKIGDHICDIAERILYYETGKQLDTN